MLNSRGIARVRRALVTDDLVIVRARAEDRLDDVAALQARSFAQPWSAEAWRWELANSPVARLYVARDSRGSAIAYCACWVVADELHINSFAVDDAWRRQGVGRRLFERVVAEAVEAGAATATLEVRRSNEAARAFYEELGFAAEGVRRDYYREPREDALILWHRHLRASPR